MFVFTHTMPGDGGVCGAVLLEVLLDGPEVDVVDFAIVELVAAGDIVLAVVLAGAAGVVLAVEDVDVFVEEGVEVFVELVVEAFDPVVVEAPEVPLVGLVDLDFDGFLFEVDELEVLDWVEELEDAAGACDLRSPEETTAISSASKTGKITLLRMGKLILSISYGESGVAAL